MDRPSSKPDPAPRKPGAAPVQPHAVSPGAPHRVMKKALTPQEIAAQARTGHAAPAQVKPPVRTEAAAPKAPPLKEPVQHQEAAAGYGVEPVQEVFEGHDTPVTDTAHAGHGDVEHEESHAPLTQAAAVELSAGEKIGWRVALAAAFIFVLSLFVPWKATQPSGPLDGSWCRVLHWAFIHGVDFGHDLVFTFGPWGFIWQGYNPSTFGYELAGWLLFGVAFFMGVVELARNFSPRWWARGLFLFVAIAIAAANPTLQDVRLFALGALLILVHFYVDDRPITWTKATLTVALALATLVKFSISFVAVAAVLTVSVEQIRRRRIPWLALIYVGGVLAFWLAAKQKLSSFGPYLYHSWIIVSGFSQGQIQAQLTETRDVTLFVLCALLLLVTLIIAHRQELQKQAVKTAWGIPALIGFAVVLLVAFKAGYVRHDGHEMAATTMLCLLSILYAAALWPSLAGRVGKALMICTVAACFGLSWQSDRVYSSVGLPRVMLSGVTQFPAHAKEAFAVMMGQSSNDADYQAGLDEIRKGMALPLVQGTCDVYPVELDLVFANGLQYQPRPVIQSYLAYDPRLEKMNADFLRSDKAPQSILFDIGFIDGRYSSLNDALSWPELLTRYDMVDNSKRMLLLQRSARPREYSIEPLGTLHALFGQAVEIPQTDDPIWVNIEFKSRPLNPLLSMVYKPPPLWLEVRTASGGDIRFQLIREVARGGFLLSPAVLDRGSFSSLYWSLWKTYLRDVMVTHMAVLCGDSTGPNASYESEYSITFSNLKFPHRSLTPISKLRQVINDSRFVVAENPPRYLPAENGQEILTLRGKTQFVVPVPTNGSTLHVQFGMPAESYTGSAKSDGVVYNVYAATPDEKGDTIATQIWTRKIDPANVEGDRGLLSQEISLPTPIPPFVLLEIVPVGASVDACWSEIEFH